MAKEHENFTGFDTLMTRNENPIFKTWQNIEGNTYVHDIFPESLPDAEIKQLKTKYAKLPEQFYTCSRLPVVTPLNVNQWLSDALQDNFIEFQEVLSGSSMLSK